MIDARISKILINVLENGDINLPDTKKLLNLIINEIYIKNQYNLLSISTQKIAKKIIGSIKNQMNLVQENFRILHLLFGLSILLKSLDIETIKNQYYYLLSKFSNLVEFMEQYELISESITFKDFAIGMPKYLFNDEFYLKKNLKEQEIYIYIYYYFSTRYYKELSQDHKIYMYPELYKVFLKAIELKQSDLVFYLYTPLLFSYNGISTTQDEFGIFNNEVESKLSNYIKDFMIPFYNLKPNNKVKKKRKIKVAFIQERIINYSINEVFTSLLKFLEENKNDKYEFVILDLNYAELGSDIKVVQKVKEFGFKYVDLHKKFVGENADGKQSPFYSIVSKVIDIRKYIIDENFDIIIGGNGRPEYNFLFTTRTAPKQFFWSHGNFEYDLKGIDKKISHFNPEKDKFNFKIFNIPTKASKISKYIKDNNIKKAREIKKQFINKIILGTIGRLIKINNIAFLTIIAKVLKENNNVIYLACGSGDKKEIENKIKILNIDPKQFIFIGHISNSLYSNVIDIFLDTFPLSQGISRGEFMQYSNNGLATKSYINSLYKFNKHKSLDNHIFNSNLLKSKLKRENIDLNDFKETLYRVFILDENDYENKINFFIKNQDFYKKFNIYNKLFNKIQYKINSLELMKTIGDIFES
ncbi:MAG: hypothetical protein U9Q30_01605, partial [Campylobacterota bacterium]|nr:hypothetical protein [Campylobacterota bacterium]